ncbi:PREDICTED: sushi, nidogen and EGF-like domain-containing protein 1 [Branchiostoma belcheri]|uniref:Sushi, nidogen and EGF-like domain-containing protein 1 n=1 Tax=Branchiostoma belcheri TaxID=7741 RepID=A0A6P4XRM8_BRABE|nr:PREDICTED: sushi, nidogen and EGF-like domain-containing protein 1 [Branchiostoma belcheri]
MPENGALSPEGANSYNDVVTFTCNQGYQLEGASSVRCQADRTWSGPVPTCTDIDECATDNGGCAETCTNVPGSYTCSCRQGYVLMPDKLGCEDTDECATDNGGCAQTCTNVPGSYNCSCRQGYVLMPDKLGCEVCGHCLGGDVNCDPVSGVCSAGCQDGWKTQLCDKAVDPPMDLTVTDITDEGFKVTWSPSPDPDLQGYRVVVSELDMTTAVNQSTIQTWLQVVGLTLETDYIIRVTVSVLSDGSWAQSNATTAEATTRMVSSTALEFVPVTETTTSLGFTWVPPEAVVTGYRIMYGQEAATEQLSPSPGPGESSALIGGLQPAVMYKVEIITIGVRQESLPLVGQKETEPDECATENGRCDQICTNVPGSYRCFCRHGFVLIEDSHGCRVCGHCLGGDVNCDPVSGVCSAGCQDGWKTQLCDKAVDPPMDLTVTDITDEGFKVTWSPSPDPDLQGYRVVVSELDMTTAANQSTDEAWFPVVGLFPETAYIIRVTALFSSGGWRSQSEAAVIPARTAATPTTIPPTTIPAATTQQTSRMTTRLSTKPATSTVQHAPEAGWDEESSDDATTPSAAETTKQTSGMSHIHVHQTLDSNCTTRIGYRC